LPGRLGEDVRRVARVRSRWSAVLCSDEHQCDRTEGRGWSLTTTSPCPPRAPTVRRRWRTAACLAGDRSVTPTPSPAETAAATAAPNTQRSSRTLAYRRPRTSAAAAPTAAARPDASSCHRRQGAVCLNGRCAADNVARASSVRTPPTTRPTLPPRRCVALQADPYELPQALRSTDAALRSGAPSCHAPEPPGKRPVATRRRRANRSTGNHIRPASHPADPGSGPLRRAAEVTRSGAHSVIRSRLDPSGPPPPSTANSARTAALSAAQTGDPWPRFRRRHGARCGAPQPEGAGSGPAPARGACPRSAHRLALALAS